MEKEGSVGLLAFPQSKTSTFVNIYKENCLKRKEDPVAIDLYQQLDDVYNWIVQQDDVEQYKKTLSMNRICIAIPAQMAEDLYDLPSGYYDTFDDQENPLYLSSLP